MKIFLLQVGFLEPETFATELSIKPVKFSSTERNIGLQRGDQQHIDFYLNRMVQSKGQGDLCLLVVEEILFNPSLHEKRQIS